MKIPAPLLLLALLLAAPAAGRGAGTTAALFVRQDTTARLTAMGGAAAALYDEPGDAWFNPAALGFMSGRRVSLTAWRGAGQDTSQAFLSALVDVGEAGTFSASYLRNASDDEDIYDIGGNLSSVQLVREFAAGPGWGYMFANNLSAGGQLKLVKSTLAEKYDASTVTFDLGLMGRSNDGRFSAGLGVQNVSGELKYYKAADPLPRIIYGGAAYRLPAGNGKFTLAADLQKPRDEKKPDFRGGLEYAADVAALRAGVKTISGAPVFTAGGGVATGWFSFDYAFQGAGELDQAVHKFTLGLSF